MVNRQQILIRSRRRQAWLADALFALAAIAVATGVVLVFSVTTVRGQTCRIDPSTGQVIPGSCGGVGQGLAQMYGIAYLPEPTCAPWSEPAVVKLRNSDGHGGYDYMTGNVVSLAGDASYVVSCGHGMGQAGDPVLAIFSDGQTCDIAELVAKDEADDVSLLKLKGGPRPHYFDLAEADPPIGTQVRMGGFANAGPYGGGWSTVENYQDWMHANGTRMRVASCKGGIYQGWSGGHVSTAGHQLVAVMHSTDGVHAYCAPVARLRIFLHAVFPNLPWLMTPIGLPLAADDGGRFVPPQAVAPPRNTVQITPDQAAQEQRGLAIGDFSGQSSTGHRAATNPGARRQPARARTTACGEYPVPSTQYPAPSPRSVAAGRFSRRSLWRAVAQALGRHGRGWDRRRIAGRRRLRLETTRWLGLGCALRRRIAKRLAGPQRPATDGGHFVDVNYQAAEQAAMAQLKQTRPSDLQTVRSFQKLRDTLFVPYETDSFASADGRAMLAFADKYPGAVAVLETFKGMRDHFLHR